MSDTLNSQNTPHIDGLVQERRNSSALTHRYLILMNEPMFVVSTWESMIAI